MAGAIQILDEGQGFAVASYTSTSVPLALNLGFTPMVARGINITDGDAEWQWFYGMDAGMCVSMTTAMASVTANGVTIMTQSSGSGIGLWLGTNCQEIGKTFLAVFER